MIKADETLEKLSTIEKSVNEMVSLRQGILELKETEANRQKVLAELRENEGRYRTLLDNLPQELFMKDKGLVYMLCSQSYAAALNQKSGEIIGKTDRDLYPAEVAEKYQSVDKRIITTGQAESTEESFVREGQSVVVRRIKTPLRGEKGEIIGILGVSWDITEQERREDELRKNCKRLEESLAELTAELRHKDNLLQGEIADRRRMEERLQRFEELEGICTSLIQNANEGIALVQDGILQLGNSKIFEISGYTNEELTSKPFREFILPEDRETFEIQPDKSMGGDLNHTTSFRMVRKDGAVRWLEDREILIHLGKDKAVMHFLTDKTHRKQAEEELLKSIEPFRKLVSNLENYLSASSGNGQESRRAELITREEKLGFLTKMGRTSRGIPV